MTNQVDAILTPEQGEVAVRPSAATVGVLLSLALLYFVLLENGAVLQSWAHALHEFFHDGRHLLGVPCH